MCSKCYRETMGAQQQAQAVAALATPKPLPTVQPPVVVEQPPVELPAAPEPQPMPEAAPAPEAPEQPSTSPPPAGEPEKKKSNRCGICSKKVGLTGFSCRCGGLFCTSHRMADDHSCGFDYKAADRTKLAGMNPAVVASKVARF